MVAQPHVDASPLGGLRGRLRLSPLRLLLAAGLMLGVAMLAARPGLLGGALGKGLTALAGANTTYFWIAGAGFLVSLVASANTWKTTLQACGARVNGRDACARYGAGSLVNTFAPLRLGDALRVALFARTLPQESSRALTAGGALGTVELARVLVQAALIAVAAVLGALPAWPVGALLGVASGGILAAALLRRRLRWGRLEHLLDAFRALAGSPRRAAALLAWTAVAALARVFAATAVTSSLGVPWSLGTGLIITAALDLATAIPLTPGNVGIASGAVALALHARGVPLTTAVASGLAFHALEALVGLAFGTSGVLALARFRTPAARRWGLGLAGAAGATLLALGVSASVLPGGLV
jgi:uncharacterized membrane protein YbhN (UPF0104 family)